MVKSEKHNGQDKMGSVNMKKVRKITAAVLKAVLLLLVLCAVFAFGMTVGASENKNELFAYLSERLSVITDSPAFTRLVSSSREPGQVKLNTAFAQVDICVGEKYENVSFYPSDISLDLRETKLSAVSSDESIAEAKVMSADETEIFLSICGVSQGKAGIVLVDENGRTVSRTVRVSVLNEKTAESSADLTSPTEAKTETVPQVTKNRAAENETAKETTKKTETENKTQAGNSEEESDIVFRTPSGSRYHRKGCRYVKSSAVSLTLSEAKRVGLHPCKVCKP